MADEPQGVTVQAVLEFSKKLAISIMVLFGLQMLAGVVAIVIDTELAAPLTQYMEACKPIYMLGIGGYDVKAGVENALKIVKDVKQLSGSTDKKEGNG